MNPEMMKLRLRSLQTKETIKIQVPNSCTLQQLKQSLSQSLPSTTAASSISFSLNTKDELLASSPDDSLSLLGITSGDLIYFSLSPNNFPSSSSPQQQQQSGIQSVNFPNMTEKQAPAVIIPVDANFDIPKSEAQELDRADGMDVDIDGGGTLYVSAQKFSEPYFLRTVLRKELGNHNNNNNNNNSELNRLVVAIHAVFVESGFVAVHSVSGTQVEWPSLRFTLPEILEDENVSGFVVLKFRSLGHVLNVYGCLDKAGSTPYRVCLDKNKFMPAMNLVWANCDNNDMIGENDGYSTLDNEKEILEFWKIVKDGLALPLLIDLCDKTGLEMPACLVRLPAELKLQILEFLPGVDIARMACVCSEMRYLSSNDDLWKKKVFDEFGDGVGMQGLERWKDIFAMESTKKKQKRKILLVRRKRMLFNPIRRDPYYLGVPEIIGGDYDYLPGFGVPSPFGQPGRAFPRFQRRWNFSPNCNLGGPTT